MKDYIAPIITNLIVLTCGAFLGMYIEDHRAVKREAIQYIDVETEPRTGVLSKILTLSKSVEIISNGKSVNSISAVCARLYNFSSKDFEKVPVYITLTPDDQSSLNVITQHVIGETGLTDTILELKDLKRPINSKAAKFGYEIKTLNRSEGIKPVFEATYFLEGDVHPKVNVRIEKAGVKDREFSYSNFYKISPLEQIIPIIAAVVFITLYLGFLVWVAKYGRKKALEKYKLLAKSLKDELTNPENKLGISNLDAVPSAAKKIVQMVRKDRWNRNDKIYRLIFRKLEPKLEDLNET